MSEPLPKGLKHPGGGPRPTEKVELAYASNKYDRITRVLMTEEAAMYWAHRIEKWLDVMRVIVRTPEGVMLYDETIHDRITSPELRDRTAWITDHGTKIPYAAWTPQSHFTRGT